MKLTITNKEHLDRWMEERRAMGRDIRAVKGKPPEGATYSDGSPIERPINIAWQDTTTGEICGIEYAVPQPEQKG